MLKRLLLCLSIAFAPTTALAQAQQSGITPVAVGKTISVTAASSSVTMGSAGSTVVMWNTGATGAYYCLCATATTANAYLPAGAVITLNIPPSQVIAAITSSSTTTLQLTQGFGWPSVGASGSSGGGGGGTSAIYGAAFPATGTPVGGSDGTNFVPLKFDASGYLQVVGIGLAQGSTTAGQTGSMVMGAVLTAPPTYTTAQTSPLSLDTAGGLRTSTLNNGVGATAAAVPANAVTEGCRGQTAENTAVTNGQLANAACDLVGKRITSPYTNPENIVSGVTAAMTGTTSTSLVASPGGALRNYITTIYCVNSHATVSTFVNIQDGSGGTTIWQIYAPALGGGAGPTFPVPLKQPTVATALFVANVTTGANVVCNANGYKGL